MDEAYKAINDVLVNLINEIWELEEKAIITEEFKHRGILCSQDIAELPLYEAFCAVESTD